MGHYLMGKARSKFEATISMAPFASRLKRSRRLAMLPNRESSLAGCGTPPASRTPLELGCARGQLDALLIRVYYWVAFIRRHPRRGLR